MCQKVCKETLQAVAEGKSTLANVHVVDNVTPTLHQHTNIHTQHIHNKTHITHTSHTQHTHFTHTTHTHTHNTQYTSIPALLFPPTLPLFSFSFSFL